MRLFGRSRNKLELKFEKTKRSNKKEKKEIK